MQASPSVGRGFAGSAYIEYRQFPESDRIKPCMSCTVCIGKCLSYNIYCAWIRFAFVSSVTVNYSSDNE
jgi:hypothetical protein